jgi:hypothetical protein
MKTRRRIGKEIEDLKKQIIEVGDRNARYKTGRVVSKMSNLTIDPRALAIFEHASNLVGIAEPKADIIKMLTQDETCGSAPQHRIWRNRQNNHREPSVSRTQGAIPMQRFHICVSHSGHDECSKNYS